MDECEKMPEVFSVCVCVRCFTEGEKRKSTTFASYSLNIHLFYQQKNSFIQANSTVLKH